MRHNQHSAARFRSALRGTARRGAAQRSDHYSGVGVCFESDFTSERIVRQEETLFSLIGPKRVCLDEKHFSRFVSSMPAEFRQRQDIGTSSSVRCCVLELTKNSGRENVGPTGCTVPTLISTGTVVACRGPGCFEGPVFATPQSRFGERSQNPQSTRNRFIQTFLSGEDGCQCRAPPGSLSGHPPFAAKCGSVHLRGTLGHLPGHRIFANRNAYGRSIFANFGIQRGPF